MHDTLVWISGATQGIGLGLARNVPFGNARVINLSRRKHPDFETLQFDLADPSSWDRVRGHFIRELAAFRGERAIFIHNAYYSEAIGMVGKVASAKYEKGVLANLAAPFVLAEAFLDACRPAYEAGLAMLSSGAAVAALEGLATYCASKVAIEHWVEVVARERQSRGGTGPWVVAVRPGGVDTPALRAAAEVDPEIYPRVASLKHNISNRVDIDTAGRRIWAALPPAPDTAVISFAEPPGDPAFHFGGPRVRQLAGSNWKLVYDAD
ncbi:MULTISPECIES: SDR family NAD(P)-dependent oxidoreductase [Hyphomicrobiales]|uniref:SDR family NAD(P)-dependent oxidoreductase n=1 Tax=Hyphomicrobiales TaxID=356 RepID=UPI00036F4470|nr:MULTISPECIES: SDR family NAD(P)-dependent oxidoreductase [Phyllobacteriaceae]MCX8572104.1 SDR family NAD(P)-dependent oxidoreductase [Aminobacter sp. MET-1]